jgi:hypothetical protein
VKARFLGVPGRFRAPRNRVEALICLVASVSGSGVPPLPNKEETQKRTGAREEFRTPRNPEPRNLKRRNRITKGDHVPAPSENARRRDPGGIPSGRRVVVDPIFTLPYSEYVAISTFARMFPKKHYAILVPTSRQQAGVDFAVMKIGTRKVLRVQVKSSRAYEERSNSRRKDPAPKMTLWFGNFHKSYREGVADIYLFLGVYPSYSLKKPVSRAAWRTVLLAMRDSEAGAFLRSIKTSKGRDDRFFYVTFTPPERGSVNAVTLTRGAGARKKASWSRFLLERRRSRILGMLR